MKVSPKTLDKVLFYFDFLPDIVQKCDPIRKNLKIDKQTMDAVLARFEADGYISSIHRIEEEDGYFAVYFNEKGRAFASTSSYQKEYWKDWPKRNWLWIIIIAAVLGAILKYAIG